VDLEEQGEGDGDEGVPAGTHQERLRKFHDKEDEMPGCVEPCLRYTVVWAAKCFGAISKVNDEVTHSDLLVGIVPFSLSGWRPIKPIALPGCLG